VENKVGFEARHDDIGNVGLYNTRRRDRFNTIREDNVQESSFAPYLENRVRWTPWLRSVAALRYDTYLFDVDSSIAANSGNASDSILSPKLSLIFGPWKQTEYYFNIGQGFHSNDARGTTIRVDPKTGDPVKPVTPLVRADFAEVGVRTAALKNLQSTLSLWYLKFDSELLFIGDAGTTEASRPSRRTGIEFTNYYTPNKWLTLDLDVAFSRARFSDAKPGGDRIPGAIEGVVSAGVAVDHPSGWFGNLRVRYFGPRPLIENNQVRSRSSTLLNMAVGRRLNRRTSLSLEIFNLLDSRSHDIDYYYASRLPGEPAGGVDDIHYHPAESRSFRVTLSRQF
jgi:outer membrane receptor protein involved in Fe transport